MTYKIVIKAKGQRRVEEANGVRELHASLALFRSQGWQIADIRRVESGRRANVADDLDLVLQ